LINYEIIFNSFGVAFHVFSHSPLIPSGVINSKALLALALYLIFDLINYEIIFNSFGVDFMSLSCPPDCIRGY
jgi:NADH:ubiquinone oxidoreductase subunit K